MIAPAGQDKGILDQGGELQVVAHGADRAQAIRRLDDALRRNVVLASPSTTMALLRTVAVTWQHDTVERNAEEVLRGAGLSDRFEHVVLVHGCRTVAELGYGEEIVRALPENEFIGDLVRDKLLYYPTVTREPFRNRGRITELLASGKLPADFGLPPLDPATDRLMLCGSPAMLKDTCKVLDDFGLTVSPKTGVRGDYLIERAFVDQ